MKKLWLVFFVFLIVLACLVLLLNKPKNESATGAKLKINGQTVNLLLAQTQEETIKGLSGHPGLKENEGMLFIFPIKDTKPSFWMKEMLFDLDMIWINDGKVVFIHKNVPKPVSGTPLNQLPLYTPDSPADSILEVNAGFSDRNNVQIGDTVELFDIN